MKEHYYFDMPKETYEYIIRQGILKESKKEKTILDLCLKGEPMKEIMFKTGYSSRTISYRKKEIYKKINRLLNNNLKEVGLKEYGNNEFKVVTGNTGLYKVYLLTFPNNKIYVGITSVDEKNRWKDGKGYIYNEFMYNDILKYGWQNIKKEILYKDLLFDEAREKEKELIIHYKSHLKRFGYNQEF